MLSRVSCNKCLAREQYRACSSLSRKRLVTRKPAVRARGGDFFRYTDAEKILLLDRLPGRVMFGRLQSIRRRAGNLSSLAPIPSRPSPWLRTCRPNMFCPGRQGRRSQAALPWILSVIIPHTKHASSLAIAATATFRFFPCLVNL